MVAYGMEVLGLDKERIAYDWQWTNRGFDFIGDVYCKKGVNKYGIDSDYLFLVKDRIVKKYKSEQFNENDRNNLASIDFADWVEDKFYYSFGRRKKWFKEVNLDEEFDLNNDNYIFIPSGTMFKKAEDKIDYIIIDEAQDFDVNDYKTQFIPKSNKSVTLFGDSAQKIYKNRGATIDTITEALRFKRFFLKYNYRLPKSIAKLAQDIINPSIDLLTDNRKDNGDSDFPNYPKPVITKYKSQEDELNGILNRIRIEDLDDVAILVPLEEDVKKLHGFLSKNNVQSQVHYRTGKTVPYNTINTLDFSNNDLPCVLTYHAAKGTEFDNVFIPFVNEGCLPDRNAFYVACTRSSRGLFISYTTIKTSFLSNIKSNCVIEHEQ